jgi:DUF4097 and DUF4098 domain-containing protein YvlB
MNARAIALNSLPVAGAALAAFLLAPTAGAQSHRVEKRFSVEGTPVVMVHNPSGRIQIKAWDKHEIMVVGQHSSGNVGVETEQVGNRIEVDTISAPGQNIAAEELHTDYEITVPTESQLQIRTDSGNVTVESVHGDMSFDTVAADLALTDVEGYLMIKSIGGSLLCTRCAGKLDATSISGNFQLLQPVMDNVRVQTSSGSILFDGSFLTSGVYVLKNYSGTIEVRFSNKDSFDVQAASLYGSVINQAPVVADKHRVRTPSYASGMAKSLFGSLNTGQAKVELSSFNGTIKILKRE